MKTRTVRLAWTIAGILLAIGLTEEARGEADWTWTTQDTALEVAFIGLQMIDYGQTRWLVKNRYRVTHEQISETESRATLYDRYETNPILGKHPGIAEVNRYFALTTFGHTAIAYALPRKAEVLGVEINPRAIWQATWIGIQTGNVIRNTTVQGGLRLNF